MAKADSYWFMQSAPQVVCRNMGLKRKRKNYAGSEATPHNI
jgi:hypothetical protein